MKLKRVNETTIKCFLSLEELSRFECDYKDFITRTEKSHLLVREVLEAANRELGYVAKSPNFDIQIVNVPNSGLMLTLSERNGMSGLDILGAAAGLVGDGNSPLNDVPQFNPDVVKNLLSGVLENIETFLKGAGVEPEKKPSAEKKVTPFTFPKLEDVDKKKPNKPAAPRPERVRDEFDKQADRAFAFNRISDIYNFSEMLPSRQRTKASLYKHENRFYLIISKGAASEDMFLRVCVTAMEFADPIQDETVIEAIKQKATLLIDGEALKKLKVKK